MNYFVANKKWRLNRKVGAAAVLISASAGVFYLMSGRGQAFPVPSYSVIRVIDGDTFETAEHQHIRVASVEAPELNRCGGPEAKAELEKLVLEKPVYLKVIYRDPYQRLVSFVYTKDSFVNEALISKGSAYYSRSSPGEIGEKLKSASDQARKIKKGIFGNPCTQTTNIKNPTCPIKGNAVSQIYYVAGCGNYDHVEVQLYLGDGWFCSEKEARAAGFRKPEQCS